MKRTVEGTFDYVRVRAEISQPSFPSSGHIYFSLRDDKNNSLSAVIWRPNKAEISVQPEHGLEVICSGKMTIYSGQSRYQLVVNNIEVAGEGALLKQLEDRRRRLADEGLFDPSLKRPLPQFPKTIGVVTSPTGAVIRDILHRLAERFGTHVLIWGVNVQGKGSAEQIAAAINGFNALPLEGKAPRPDLLIIARGGGSLEDLWSFNEEIVVRAAADSVIPLISAIGHETDNTLIDYAADKRAPTPTAAAELASPVAADIKARIAELEARLARSLSSKLAESGLRLKANERGLPQLTDMIERHHQNIDIAIANLEAGLQKRLVGAKDRLSYLSERLAGPMQQVLEVSQKIHLIAAQIEHHLERRFVRAQDRLERAASLLSANSYQNVLQRGFVMITDQQGAILKRSAEAPKNAEVMIQFADERRHAKLDRARAASPKSQKAPISPPLAKSSTPLGKSSTSLGNSSTPLEKSLSSPAIDQKDLF